MNAIPPSPPLHSGATTIWRHFILAAAVARLAGEKATRAPSFRYVDTHAGPGVAERPAGLGAALAAGLAHDAYAAAVAAVPSRYPGSWVLVDRVVRRAAPALELELDVNDLSETVIAQARRAREGEDGWVRFWSHDWFLFLRSRLGFDNRPDAVFIDPPPDDPRGPAYAIDAAILLDTLAVPYMVAYPVQGDTQSAIDLIGRTGIELVDGDMPASGVLLGGGAEAALLTLLPDLRRLAAALGARLHLRLPRGEDYCI